MKRNKNELDVDSIGGDDPLTKEETDAISRFIKTRKIKIKSSAPKKNHVYKTSEVFSSVQEKEHPYDKKRLKKN